MVISSLVIYCHSEFLDYVSEQIKTLPCVEIVGSHNSKFAVVIETETTEQSAELAEEIRLFTGVLSLELVTHFFEDEVQNS
ncbi:chaperone NapD [bacterium]|nr:chaperone NapD [bacterium]